MSTTAIVPVEETLTADYLPPVNPKAVEQALLIGDLSQMTDEQRIAYYVATCRSCGLNPLTKPFQALKGDDGKLTLYPDKGCAEQLRKIHKVSTKVIGRDILDGVYVVTVVATLPDGRTEESQGAVALVKPKGRWEDYDYRGQQRRRFKAELGSDGQEVMLPLSPSERAKALMTAETKAKRRVTLAICGLGLPEYDDEPGSRAHPQHLALHVPDPAEADKTTEMHIADLYGETMPGPAAAPAPTPTGATGPHWDTLRSLQGDARLPESVLEHIQNALAPLAPASDKEARTLASTVLDWLAAHEEDTAEESSA